MMDKDTDVSDEDTEHSYDQSVWDVTTRDQRDGTFFTMSNQVLTFIRPFVDGVHAMATQPEVLFPNHKLTVSCHGAG